MKIFVMVFQGELETHEGEVLKRIVPVASDLVAEELRHDNIVVCRGYLTSVTACLLYSSTSFNYIPGFCMHCSFNYCVHVRFAHARI